MRRIESLEALRELYDAPRALARRKIVTQFDNHSRNFIGLSPFVLIASHGEAGGDVSPRGDPPGFVHVLDDTTLLIPDRPGNNRIDTLENILGNPRVGLLFLVPGLGETLRVNGLADVVVGPELEILAHAGRVPKAAIRVTAQEIYFHCAKAIIRSRLWDESAQIARSAFPPLGQVLADQIGGLDAETQTAAVERSYRERLY